MITKKIEMDLARKGITPVVDAVQGDSGITLAFSLYADGTPWVIPEGAQVIVQYGRDGFGGTYDTLPDGSAAFQAEGNILTVALAPQVCSLWGDVQVQTSIYSGDKRLSTFAIILRVEKTIPWEREPENYVNLTQWLLTHENASAEVIDMRTGWDGTVYDYAGTAVRTQFAQKAGAILESASGKRITLPDSADIPLRDLKLYVPEGASSAKLTVAGKNLAKRDDNSRQYIIDPPVPAGTYFQLSFTATGDFASVDFYPYATDGTNDDTNRRKANVVKGERYTIQVRFAYGDLGFLKMWDEYAKVTDVQVEIAGSATDYEPYSAEAHTILLPETAGGYVDFGAGKFVSPTAEYPLSDLPRIGAKYPVTNLSTDGESISFTYVADTKKYIENYVDKKCSELAAAIVANS